MQRPNRAVIVAAALGCLFVPAEGFAGDGLTGRWIRSKVLRSGELTVWTLDLKQDGNKVTGTFSFSGGAVFQIEEGKIDKDRISFKFKESIGSGPTRATCTGTLKDDDLDVTWQPELRGKKMPAWKAVFRRSRAPREQVGEPSGETAPSTSPRLPASPGAPAGAR